MESIKDLIKFSIKKKKKKKKIVSLFKSNKD